MAQTILGDIIYLTALGRRIIVINSYEAARDLFENSAAHADRPRYVMSGELMGLRRLVFKAPYGETWKTARKLLHPHMNKNAVSKYGNHVENAARAYLKTLLQSPQDFHKNLSLYIILTFVFL